jgi:hypothetical protein
MQNALMKTTLGLTVITASFALPAPAGAFTLHNYSTGYCLAVSGANQNEGASMIVWTCNSNDPSQKWGWNGRDGAFPSDTGNQEAAVPYYTDVSQSHNWVLGVANGNNQYYDGQPVIDWAWTGDANQYWSATWAVNNQYGHACYFFENWNVPPGGDPRTPHKVLGVSGGSHNQGAAVVVWSLFTDLNGRPDYINHPDQYWCVYN